MAGTLIARDLHTVTRVLEVDEIAHTATEYGGGWAGYLELCATAARHAEERLDAYDGTLLLVTHDRQLLDAVALDRTIRLGAATSIGGL